MKGRGETPMADATCPSPLAGEGGARAAKAAWEGEGLKRPSRATLLSRARFMRANPTEAERRLWSLLRGRRLATFKFKRQQIVDWYVVDFICLSARLIIEADGSQHADNKDDERRTAYLRRQGFRVLRFWNNQVLSETNAVADSIFAALIPHPPIASQWAPPSPAKGRGAFGGASNG
jgi:very-short-patch-repair endonuclease